MGGHRRQTLVALDHARVDRDHDPNYIALELEFDGRDEADAFKLAFENL